MTDQEESLLALASVLERLEIPYMVIGGLANAVWGEPRATLDIDVTILLPEQRVPELVEALVPAASPLVADPVQFIGETSVLPLESASGVRIDLIFGRLPFEEEAVERAAQIEVRGETVRFCTAEDLILLKIVSTRRRDLEDVRGVVRRRLRLLDLDYLEPRVLELADLLDRPEISEEWQSAKELAASD